MDNKSGIPLFKLAGFQVRLDYSWFLLALLITWTLAAGYFPYYFPNLTTTTYWVMGIIGALGLFVSVILHELSHSIVGRKYGIPIEGITLFIFGGIASMGDMPPNPKAEFLMSIVGPLTSIALGIIFYIFVLIGKEWHISVAWIGILDYLSMINFVVGVFNLLPGFPLDGGRIFRSILWWWKGNLKWATKITCDIGKLFGISMMILGVIQIITGFFISGLWLLVLGFFLERMAKTSYEFLLIKQLFSDEKIKQYAKTDLITVPWNITLAELMQDYFYHHYHKLYPVMQNDQLVGYISLNDIQPISKEQWAKVLVSSVMHNISDAIAIDAETKVMDVLQKMTAQQQHRFIITSQGNLYGLITIKDIMHIVSLRLSIEE